MCILKSKAIACPRTGRFKCPVPNCSIDGRSRVGVAKHFRRDHKDYRSWRDVFIRKDAPDFILKPPDENDENIEGNVEHETNLSVTEREEIQQQNSNNQGLLMVPSSITNLSSANLSSTNLIEENTSQSLPNQPIIAPPSINIPSQAVIQIPQQPQIIQLPMAQPQYIILQPQPILEPQPIILNSIPGPYVIQSILPPNNLSLSNQPIRLTPSTTSHHTPFFLNPEIITQNSTPVVEQSNTNITFFNPT